MLQYNQISSKEWERFYQCTDNHHFSCAGNDILTTIIVLLVSEKKIKCPNHIISSIEWSVTGSVCV